MKKPTKNKADFEPKEDKGEVAAVNDYFVSADCKSCVLARGDSMCRTPDGLRAVVVQKPDGCKRYKKK